MEEPNSLRARVADAWLVPVITYKILENKLTVGISNRASN